MGRHSHPDELEPELAPAGSTEPAESADSTGVASVVAPPKTTAVADLQFLLRRPRLLLACIAAVVIPFATYFIVIGDLGKLSDWALFIGAPMVLAGVLVGALLDRAYERLLTGPRAARLAEPAGPAGPVGSVALGSRSVEGAHP